MKTAASPPGFVAKLIFLTALFFCASNSLHAQEKIEIVIVGSAHGNSGTDEFYRPVIDKLKNYKPDMVFGEYLSESDMQKALEANHSSSANILKKMDYLKSRNPKAAGKKANLNKAYEALDKFAYHHKTRMNLARDLYLNYDRGNAEYQFWVLEKQMQDKFGKSEQAYFEKLFGSADSLRKAGFIRKSSEYHRIFFPLVYELGHAKIYPADCQVYDADWNKAMQKALAGNKAMKATAKADSTSEEAAAVKALNLYSAEAGERMKGIDYTSYAFLNSALYAELDEYVNFLGGPRFFNEPGYITVEVKQMLYWWEKRNQGICENIIRQAKERGATKVIVGVGSSHRKGMEEIFTKMPNVKLVNYNDLP
ncbi:hypothetical protein H7F15_05100 [Pontibacter sp. Tf4]|uniref:DUF5694 domain-containing protein n=1 Tax=Pontibacter sp. Tf4 TaxID=2761620 RepID=UPI00162A0278|nr:DUF5694 domain-containing protein [Pontibacter sp. Tf4]MBB6610408.1 hypothetical protein [Pontibacter sp. Tf4]